jgi:hypothetical protein
LPDVTGYLRERISSHAEKSTEEPEMFDNTMYVKSEMDYRAEKIKRGIVDRRRRSRKALVRRQTPQSEIIN